MVSLFILICYWTLYKFPFILGSDSNQSWSEHLCTRFGFISSKNPFSFRAWWKSLVVFADGLFSKTLISHISTPNFWTCVSMESAWNHRSVSMAIHHLLFLSFHTSAMRWLAFGNNKVHRFISFFLGSVRCLVFKIKITNKFGAID